MAKYKVGDDVDVQRAPSGHESHGVIKGVNGTNYEIETGPEGGTDFYDEAQIAGPHAADETSRGGHVADDASRIAQDLGRVASDASRADVGRGVQDGITAAKDVAERGADLFKRRKKK